MDAIRLKCGFRAGHIYEKVYHSQDPRLVGMGFAAVRDVASYIKHNPDALFPAPSQRFRLLANWPVYSSTANCRSKVPPTPSPARNTLYC